MTSWISSLEHLHQPAEGAFGEHHPGPVDDVVDVDAQGVDQS
jgi:hypothetical protein